MTPQLRSSPAWLVATDEVRRAAPYLDPRDMDAIGALPNPLRHAPDARLVGDLAAALFAWRSRLEALAPREPTLPHLDATMCDQPPINLLVPLTLSGFLVTLRRLAQRGFEAAEDATRPPRDRALPRLEARRRAARAHATTNALIDAAFAGTPAVFAAITLPRVSL